MGERKPGESLTDFVQRMYEEGMHPDAAIAEGKRVFGNSRREWNKWRGIHMTRVIVDMSTGMGYDRKGNMLNLKGTRK